jgi:hypothetical protein
VHIGKGLWELLLEPSDEFLGPWHEMRAQNTILAGFGIVLISSLIPVVAHVIYLLYMLVVDICRALLEKVPTRG